MSADDVRRLVETAQVVRPRRELSVARSRPEPDNQPRELDLAVMMKRAASRPQMLLPGLQVMPLGEPCLLVAHGGGFKSTLARQLAVCAAAGAPFMREPLQQMRAAYLSFEDPEHAMHWGLERAAFAAEVSPQDLVGWLRVFDGTTWPGTWFTKNREGLNEFTDDFRAIRERVKGCQLIVIDGCADVFAANENDRAAVKAFVRGLRTMTPPDGVLLLIAHLDKQGVKEGEDALGFSGSTSWHNAVRSRLFMHREVDESDKRETGRIVVENKKSNWGKQGGRMILEYDEGYHYLRRVDEPEQSRVRPSNKLQDVEEAAALKSIIRAAVAKGDPIPAATNGKRSAHEVMSAHAGFPEGLRSSRGVKRFYVLLNRLRAAGEVKAERGPRSSSGHYKDYLTVPEKCAAQENARAGENAPPEQENQQIAPENLQMSARARPPYNPPAACASAGAESTSADDSRLPIQSRAN